MEQTERKGYIVAWSTEPTKKQSAKTAGLFGLLNVEDATCADEAADKGRRWVKNEVAMPRDKIRIIRIHRADATCVDSCENCGCKVTLPIERAYDGDEIICDDCANGGD